MGDDASAIHNDLLVPFAGYRNYNDAGVYSLGGNASLWSSSPYSAENSRSRYLYLYVGGKLSMDSYNRAGANSLRCIYDSYDTYTKAWSSSSEDGDWLITVNIAALNGGENTCTLENYIFSWIFASPSVVFRNISQSVHCIFGNAKGSVVTLQLSWDLTDGSGNTIPEWNVRLKNTAWIATPAGLQWASSAITEYTWLNQTLTLFNKVANKIWEATWSAVDIQVEIPWWTPDGVYNWTLVLSY